jgi:hypothetical protein
MAAKVPSSARLLILKSKNHVSKKKKRKMERMSHAFGCTYWNVQDFGEKLSLNAFRLDVRCDIPIDIISKDELVTFFGKRSSLNCWKVKPCDLLSVEDCEGILKLYETIYVHPPSNGDYSGIFLKVWLANRKNYCINWVL